ncbi:MAG: VWA domain-containing protein [Streptosporangiaceae bacterium]
MSQPDFSIEIFQNEYLPDGGQDVNAIVTVTSGEAVAVSDTSAAEIIIVDCSGSMSSPQTKISEARAATAAAIDAIRDGVAFAVIAGTNDARPVFPTGRSLVVASGQTREDAKKAVARLRPGGGTAIGKWLRLAHQMFTTHRISTALLGTVDIVPDPSGLAADFAAIMASAMGKQVADVAVDAATGTVRLKKKVDDADEMALDTRSTKTVRTRK